MGSGKAGRSNDEIARLVEQGLARGLDIVDSVIAARADRPLSKEARALDRANRAAVAKHEKAVRRHQRWVARQQSAATGWTAAAGVTGTIGVLDVVTDVANGAAVGAMPGPAWLWLGAAGVSAFAAVRARLRLRRATPPPAPVMPAPPPASLPAGARGYQESVRLATVRVRLAEIAPAVERLHPDAGMELRRADAEAAPPLGALVDRLAVLARIERDMPGTEASTSAAAAAEEVRRRLATGVDTYEHLLAAAAAMLAAPDLDRSTDAVLGPAADALSAYAHGLSVSADVFRADPPATGGPAPR